MKFIFEDPLTNLKPMTILDESTLTKGLEMKNKWEITKQYKIHNNIVPGVYSANTNSGRKIYCFSNSPEEAMNNVMNSVKYNEKITSIGRVHE